jgi:hypothetical protein
VLKYKKQKSKDFYNFFALKNTEFLVRTTNSRANTNKNKKLKAGGLHPPAFNNNLNDNNFVFNKPICRFDNKKTF